MTVGDYLVSVRKQAGLAQARVASLADVSQSTLSDIENNGRDPTLTTFISLCKALSVSPAKSLAIIIGEDADVRQPFYPFFKHSLSNHEMEVLSSLISLMPSQQLSDRNELRAVDGLAAAGSPIFTIDYNEDEYITINPKYMDNSRFLVIKVLGDSMQPKINDGDYVVVQRHLQPHEGEIALVQFSMTNGYDEYSIKRYSTAGDTVKLVSINKKYAPIFVKMQDILSIEKVVDVIRYSE